MNCASPKRSFGNQSRCPRWWTSVYNHDAAGNLSNRVQNLFTNTFNVNALNELT